MILVADASALIALATASPCLKQFSAAYWCLKPAKLTQVNKIELQRRLFCCYTAHRSKNEQTGSIVFPSNSRMSIVERQGGSVGKRVKLFHLGSKKLQMYQFLKSHQVQRTSLRE